MEKKTGRRITFKCPIQYEEVTQPQPKESSMQLHGNAAAQPEPTDAMAAPEPTQQPAEPTQQPAQQPPERRYVKRRLFQ